MDSAKRFCGTNHAIHAIHCLQIFCQNASSVEQKNTALSLVLQLVSSKSWLVKLLPGLAENFTITPASPTFFRSCSAILHASTGSQSTSLEQPSSSLASSLSVPLLTHNKPGSLWPASQSTSLGPASPKLVSLPSPLFSCLLALNYSCWPPLHSSHHPPIQHSSRWPSAMVSSPSPLKTPLHYS